MEGAEAKAGAAAAFPAQSPAAIPAGAQPRAAAFLAAPKATLFLPKSTCISARLGAVVQPLRSSRAQCPGNREQIL